MRASQIDIRLNTLADPQKAAHMQRYFKTGPGEYGAGDSFLGIQMGPLRRIAREFRLLPLTEMAALITSPLHEARMTALLILTYQYPVVNPQGREQIYRFYLDHTRFINNWDLVDVTAPHVVGVHLLDRDKTQLYRLCRSDWLWDRRIAMIATLAFIRENRFQDTFRLADQLLDDTHDLMHKAVGWMLREAGKRDQNALEAFLKARYGKMPRTMLRYAIERLPETRRQGYLKGTV